MSGMLREAPTFQMSLLHGPGALAKLAVWQVRLRLFAAGR